MRYDMFVDNVEPLRRSQKLLFISGIIKQTSLTKQREPQNQ